MMETIINNFVLGKSNLSEGYYEIQAQYFQSSIEYGLKVGYSVPGTDGLLVPIPDSVLFPCYTDPDLKIIRRWYIENDPYTKVEPKDINSDGRYDGWILTEGRWKTILFWRSEQ